MGLFAKLRGSIQGVLSGDTLSPWETNTLVWQEEKAKRVRDRLILRRSGKPLPTPIVLEADPERFTALEYLVVNAAFWLFCLVNLLVAKWFMGEATGLFFFFGVMALGFTVACVLSYLHDRFYEDDLPGQESP